MALPFTPVSSRPSLLSTRTRLSSGQGSNHLSEILTTSVIRARWIFHQATTASDSGGEAMWHYQVCLMKEKVDFPCNLETGTKKLFYTGGGSIGCSCCMNSWTVSRSENLWRKEGQHGAGRKKRSCRVSTVSNIQIKQLSGLLCQPVALD